MLVSQAHLLQLHVEHEVRARRDLSDHTLLAVSQREGDQQLAQATLAHVAHAELEACTTDIRSSNHATANEATSRCCPDLHFTVPR